MGPKRGTFSGYALFGERQFRNLWGANLVLTLGLVMLMLGASWTMTSLTDNPVLVSMVQTVMSLPFVIFGIPVGVASDALGHRTLLLMSQFWMLAVTGLMGVIALTGGWDFTPALLLSTMFLVGIGVVVQQAAWKPFLHSLVPEDELVSAISLNSLSNKISQTLGPILGGYLMGLAGTAVVLFTRAVSHVVLQGSMALGSLGFGILAQHAGVSRSILIAGVVAMSGLSLVGVYRIPDADPEPSAG